jgi:hypothetical protein
MRDGRQRASSLGERPEHREEQSRDQEIEAGVKVGNGPRRVRLEGDQLGADPIEQCNTEGAADHAVDQIADRQSPGGGITAHAAFQQRVDGGAEIGT